MTGGGGSSDRTAVAGLPCAVLLFAALLCSVAGCGGPETAPRTEQAAPATSLLLITVDTLRTDHLSTCGHPAQISPHLDDLARHGTLIPHVVTPANTTLPAHASLLTSLPPEGHGGFGNGIAIGGELPTLARACRHSGMATAAMVSSWVVGTGWNLEQGFDQYLPLYKTGRRPSAATPSGFLPLQAGDTSRAAARWLRRNRDRPFMLWLHYMDPHQQYAPPPPYRTPRNRHLDRPRTIEQFLDLHHRRQPLPPAAASAVRDDYAGEVRYTDRCIGEVIHLLRALGLEQSTLVAVTADHGEALGEKDCYFGHTLSLGEPVNRVPLILAGPGVAAGVLHRPATLLDVAPTILALLGIDAPDGFQGRDLSPLLRQSPTPGGKANDIPAPLLFTRGEDGRRAWLVDGMKATFDAEGRLTGLHDLHRDPLEKVDLRDEQPLFAEELSRRYMAPHTHMAAMAARWADRPPQPADEETARKLKDLGYVEE